MVGVVIDSKYNNYYSGRGAEEALSILNTTDGLFREELGIALKIETVVVIDNSANDPMNLGNVTMEDMMRNFRDYRLVSPDLGSGIGLATLFSGNKNTDSALGLAWIGSACRTDGYDVSVVTPYMTPILPAPPRTNILCGRFYQATVVELSPRVVKTPLPKRWLRTIAM